MTSLQLPQAGKSPALDGTKIQSIFPLSARTRLALANNARRLAQYVESTPIRDLTELAATYQVGRTPFPFRRVICAASTEELATRCIDLATKIEQGLALTEVVRRRPNKIAFLFTGQGSQYVGMAQGLLEAFPTFADSIEQCAKVLDEWLPRPLKELLCTEDNAEVLQDTAVTQPVLFAFELALARLWISFGFTPSIVLGHSLGEWTAACVAGAYGVEDACRVVFQRGAMAARLCASGTMLSAGMDEATLHEVLGDSVECAVRNSPEQVVLGGGYDAIERARSVLEGHGIPNQLLEVSRAFHTSFMDPMLEPFRAEVAATQSRKPSIPIISGQDGTIIDEPMTDERWVRQVREAVRFDRALATLDKLGCDLAIEIGPHAVLSRLAVRQLSAGTTIVASMNRGRIPVESLAEAIGKTWEAGFDVDWPRVHGRSNLKRLHAPTYAFDRRPLSEGVASSGADDSAMAPATFAPVTGDGPVRAAVRKLWSETLRMDVVDATMNFHESGADSLDAVRLIARLRKSLGIEITLEEFFDLGSFQAVSELVEERVGGSTSAGKDVGIVRQEARDVYPLSHAQQRMLFQSMLAENPSVNNVNAVLPLPSGTTPDEVEQALHQLAVRHTSLRTAYDSSGATPLQRILPQPNIVFAQTVLTETDKQRLDDELQKVIRSSVATRLDLSTGNILFAHVVLRPVASPLLILIIHHIAMDGRSMEILHRDLLQLLRAKGQPVDLAGSDLNYVDYVLWELDQLSNGSLAKQAEFWTTKLADAPTDTALPFDRPPLDMRDRPAAEHKIRIDDALLSGLRRTGTASNTSLFVLLLAAFKSCLASFQTVGGTTSDVVVGVPAAGRLDPSLEEIVGLFVNTIPVRTEWEKGISSSEFIASVGKSVLQALDYQAYPLDLIARDLADKRRPGRAALFTVMFNMRVAVDGTKRGDVDSTEAFGIGSGVTDADLYLFVVDEGASLQLIFTYAKDCLDPGTVERVVERFVSVLSDFVRDMDPVSRQGNQDPATRPTLDRPISTTDEARNVLIAGGDAAIQSSLVAEIVAFTDCTVWLHSTEAATDRAYSALPDLGRDGIRVRAFKASQDRKSFHTIFALDADALDDLAMFHCDNLVHVLLHDPSDETVALMWDTVNRGNFDGCLHKLVKNEAIDHGLDGSEHPSPVMPAEIAAALALCIDIPDLSHKTFSYAVAHPPYFRTTQVRPRSIAPVAEAEIDARAFFEPLGLCFMHNETADRPLVA